MLFKDKLPPPKFKRVQAEKFQPMIIILLKKKKIRFGEGEQVDLLQTSYVKVLETS